MTTWTKSARCTSGMCIETAQIDGLWHYRQTSDPDTVIAYTAAEHEAITAEILGRSQIGSSGLIIWRPDGGMVLCTPAGSEISLVYTVAEVDAYRAGLETNQFQPVPTITPPAA